MIDSPRRHALLIIYIFIKLFNLKGLVMNFTKLRHDKVTHLKKKKGVDA